VKHAGRITNHHKLVKALSAYVGQELPTSRIRQMVQSMYPEFPDGSVLPNDHAEGNKSPCLCANTPQRIFERVSRGLFRVRPL